VSGGLAAGRLLEYGTFTRFSPIEGRIQIEGRYLLPPLDTIFQVSYGISRKTEYAKRKFPKQQTISI